MPNAKYENSVITAKRVDIIQRYNTGRTSATGWKLCNVARHGTACGDMEEQTLCGASAERPGDDVHSRTGTDPYDRWSGLSTHLVRVSM